MSSIIFVGHNALHSYFFQFASFFIYISTSCCTETRSQVERFLSISKKLIFIILFCSGEGFSRYVCVLNFYYVYSIWFLLSSAFFPHLSANMSIILYSFILLLLHLYINIYVMYFKILWIEFCMLFYSSILFISL
jgi:hypothetical protein